jgi:hypothetical protein
MDSSKKRILIAVLAGILLGFLIVFLFQLIKNLIDSNKNNHKANNTIVVVMKENQKLAVFDVLAGKIKEYNVSTGENPGNKISKGDLKTPEGVFHVIGIEDATDWSYDFEDGKGPILGSYGPFFIRLKVDSTNLFHNTNTRFDFPNEDEFNGIGIHGTHLNGLIGKRASHGCIRMKNEDLIDFKQYIQPGTLVVVIPGKMDININNLPDSIIRRTLK